MPELPRQDAAITKGSRWRLVAGGEVIGEYTHEGIDGHTGLIVLREDQGDALQVTRGVLRLDKRWELVTDGA